MTKRGKKAQVTIFIIIAIVIIAAVILFIIFKDRFIEGIPATLEPTYTTLLSCIEEETKIGADILGTQAGYIYLPEFEPGSEYMPFSSQLDFAGSSVPYWYYISGNNIQKEQVPSLSNMEKQLGNFIQEKINNCNFESYYEEGFEITWGEEKEPKTTISDNKIGVELNKELTITKGEDTATIKTHEIEINSKLGSLYKSAKEIYETEQESLFLETYAIDTLRLYAPVDGVELTCSPKTWNADDIFNDLKNAIESNTLAIKNKGGDHSLRQKQNKYFVTSLNIDNNVRFINSKNWSNNFEVNPSNGNMLIAKPVGNQPGMGLLGFCYAPYHFVYNLGYPVLVQVYSNEEVFQFPLAIVIQGNNPRQPLDSTATSIENPEICENANTKTQIITYDSKLNPIKADISYECFGVRCDIGKTSTNGIEANLPQCVNGYIISKAEGYEDQRTLYTTMETGTAEIIMDKLYPLEINLKINNNEYNGQAIINFISNKSSKSIIYPEQKSVDLSQGQYDIQVYIYKNSTIKIPETTTQQCMKIAKEGISSLFGLTEEKCFEITTPEQIISNALSAGGNQKHFILESELQNSRTIEINTKTLPTPNTLEQLQDNHALFEKQKLDILIK